MPCSPLVTPAASASGGGSAGGDGDTPTSIAAEHVLDRGIALLSDAIAADKAGKWQTAFDQYSFAVSVVLGVLAG